jgi:hypothetical protein
LTSLVRQVQNPEPVRDAINVAGVLAGFRHGNQPGSPNQPERQRAVPKLGRRHRHLLNAQARI